MQTFGASPETWDLYEKNGWGAHMLPVVSNPNTKIDENSKMKQLGKTPSVLTPSGTVVGLRGWTTLEITDAMRDAWASKDYGICIRTGEVLAFDCDVEDANKSKEILDLFTIMFGEAPLRRRPGSNRWLAVLRVDIPMSKSRITFDEKDAFEVLGSGQQFVAEGQHPSGYRYEWTQRPVLADLPCTTHDSVRSFLNQVATAYGVEASQGKLSARPKGKTKLIDDPLADWLRASGFVLDESEGVMHIVCPWHEHHTSESSISGTTYFARGVNGETKPGFKCMHAHCSHRTYEDLLEWAYRNGYTDPTVVNAFPVLPPLQDDVEERKLFDILRRNTDEKTATISATLPTVMAALQLKQYARVMLAYDTFTGGVVYKDIQDSGKPLRGDKAFYSDWAVFGDAEFILMRERLEREFSFKSISRELMRDAVNAVAHGGLLVVDTMVEYLNRHLPAWDGVPRVESFFSKYCGCLDDDYSRALGRYVFAALAGRALTVDGIKADIVPILVGKQGTFKSTLIASLAFKPGTSRELTFSAKDDDIRRSIRGASVVEIPELSGLARREANDVKFFLSLAEDSWIPKYQESIQTVKRRCVFFASTNEHQILNDPTGSRRFAPIVTGEIKIDDIRLLIPQLWAEGREIFINEGIKHRKVEILAAERAHMFELRDPWLEVFINWFNEEAKRAEDDRVEPTTRYLLEMAIGIPASRIKMSDSRRAGNLLRSMGYFQRCKKDENGTTIRVWVK